MDLVFPDEGLTDWYIFGLPSGVTYRLFTNNVAIDRSTIASGLTEAAWTGYSAQSLSSGAWTTQPVVGHVGIVTASPLGFSNTSGSPVTTYGYYVTSNVSGRVLAAANFDTVPQTIADGDTLIVMPILGDFSELSS